MVGAMERIIDRLADGDFCCEVLEDALRLDGEEQDALFALARTRRDERFPFGSVEVRSVLEISNYCRQRCGYCGIGAHGSRFLYTIDFDSFMETVERLYRRGRRHLLIQSGENRNQQYIEHTCRCISEAQRSFPDLCLTLNLGNLSKRQYYQLRSAGAARYILKFETSNRGLYRKLKPRDRLEKRLKCLRDLSELGFRVGSGSIVGLPGQSHADMVQDLELLADLELGMGSASAFIPGKGTEFEDQPAGDLEITLNVMALIRIMNPQLLIPSTTSLEKRAPGGQLRGLVAGANSVTIHDGTPEKLKSEYPIYTTDRFTPDEEHIRDIVVAAGLKLG